MYIELQALVWVWGCCFKFGYGGLIFPEVLCISYTYAGLMYRWEIFKWPQHSSYLQHLIIVEFNQKVFFQNDDFSVKKVLLMTLVWIVGLILIKINSVIEQCHIFSGIFCFMCGLIIRNFIWSLILCGDLVAPIFLYDNSLKCGGNVVRNYVWFHVKSWHTIQLIHAIHYNL